MAKLWYGFLYAYKRISFKTTDIGEHNTSINSTTIIMVIILEMKIIDKSK